MSPLRNSSGVKYDTKPVDPIYPDNIWDLYSQHENIPASRVTIKRRFFNASENKGRISPNIPRGASAPH